MCFGGRPVFGVIYDRESEDEPGPAGRDPLLVVWDSNGDVTGQVPSMSLHSIPGMTAELEAARAANPDQAPLRIEVTDGPDGQAATGWVGQHRVFDATRDHESSTAQLVVHDRQGHVPMRALVVDL